MVKKRDFLTPVGERMTKSPKNNKAKDIKKTREELQKERREKFYQSRRYQIVSLRAMGRSMRKIADRIGMSIGFVCKWCRRLAAQIHDRAAADRKGKKRVYYTKDGGEGIREAVRSMPRAPKSPYRKVTPEHKAAVIEFRKGHFTQFQGPHKIKASLDLDISHQTIYKILADAGLVKRQKRRKRKFEPFRRGHPNELWQIDYKILEKGGRGRPGIYLLSVKDDHSSAILAADVRTTCLTDDVVEILNRTMEMFGKPEQILSDHGTQWCSANGGGCRFDEWCLENGIEHIMGKVRKPTTQGKIERWHGTVKTEGHLPPKGSSPEDYEKAVQALVEYYNVERPHRGIGLQTPFYVYTGGLILPELFTTLGVHEVS
jgi:transposase InsO family protein